VDSEIRNVLRPLNAEVFARATLVCQLCRVNFTDRRRRDIIVFRITSGKRLPRFRVSPTIERGNVNNPRRSRRFVRVRRVVGDHRFVLASPRGKDGRRGGMHPRDFLANLEPEVISPLGSSAVISARIGKLSISARIGKLSCTPCRQVSTSRFGGHCPLS
jgi:hypothetical protein